MSWRHCWSEWIAQGRRANEHEAGERISFTRFVCICKASFHACCRVNEPYRVPAVLLGTEFLELRAGLYDALSAWSKLLLALFVGVLRTFYGLAYALVALHELADPVEYLVRQFIDLLVVLGLCNLCPCEAYHSQCSKESLLIGNEDVHLHGLAPQVGLCVQCSPQRTGVRNEHYHVVHSHLGGLDV